VDAIAWLTLGTVVVVALGGIAVAPRLHRNALRRRIEGEAGTLGGIGAGWDSVWRPSAEEAQARWQAQVEIPAPAPTPGEKGRMHDGRIVLDGSA